MTHIFLHNSRNLVLSALLLFGVVQQNAFAQAAAQQATAQQAATTPKNIAPKTIAEWFEKFPNKREFVSLTASPTNAVVIDAQNNYLRITTASKTETAVQTTTTVFKMFMNTDGTPHFAYQVADDAGKGNGCLKSVTSLFVVQDDGEWKDVTTVLVPSVRISEFYGKKNVPNLMDVNGVISLTPDHNRSGTGLGVVLELPQQGNTVLARLLPRCDTAALPEYTQLLADCKFKTIELGWDAAHTWFIIAKKLEK